MFAQVEKDEEITPSIQTWSDAITVSESICRDERVLPNSDWLYFEPALH